MRTHPLTLVNGVHQAHFSSVTELISWAKDADAMNCTSSRTILESYVKQIRRNPSWVEYRTYEQLDDWLVNPPSELLEAVGDLKERLGNKLAVPTKRSRKRASKLEAGEELDAQAWVSRDTEGWSDMVRIRKPKSIIKLGVNVTVSCEQKQKDLMYRGAVIVALSDLLQAMGHETEITLFSMSREYSSNQHQLLVTCDIKRAGEPLNLGAAVVALADIGFGRLVVMPAEAKVCTSQAYDYFGYRTGMPSNYPHGMDLLVDTRGSSYGMDMNWAEQFILAKLKEFSDVGVV